MSSPRMCRIHRTRPYNPFKRRDLLNSRPIRYRHLPGSSPRLQWVQESWHSRLTMCPLNSIMSCHQPQRLPRLLHNSSQFIGVTLITSPLPAPLHRNYHSNHKSRIIMYPYSQPRQCPPLLWLLHHRGCLAYSPLLPYSNGAVALDLLRNLPKTFGGILIRWLEEVASELSQNIGLILIPAVVVDGRNNRIAFICSILPARHQVHGRFPLQQ